MGPYRASVVDLPQGRFLVRYLQVQGFGEFVTNPTLELGRSSRSEVCRGRVGDIVGVLGFLNRPVRIVFAFP